MTKKRYQKLFRAYVTRLNEYARRSGKPTLPMGEIYKSIRNSSVPVDMSRDEWWDRLRDINKNVFGVGEKVRR